MKFILLALLLASACTQKSPSTGNLNPSPQNPKSIDSFEMELAPSTINLEMMDTTLSGSLEDSSDAISVGGVYAGAKVTKRITLIAQSDIPNLNIDGFRNAQIFTFKSTTYSLIV